LIADPVRGAASASRQIRTDLGRHVGRQQLDHIGDQVARPEIMNERQRGFLAAGGDCPVEAVHLRHLCEGTIDAGDKGEHANAKRNPDSQHLGARSAIAHDKTPSAWLILPLCGINDRLMIKL
jgi:hypothetical protein